MSGKDDKAGRNEKKVDEDKLKDAPRDSDNLEEGLEDSMDASDPPSTTQPKPT